MSGLLLALFSGHPDAIGPGSVDRTLRPIWRSFFRPPDVDEDMRPTPWGQERAQPSGLIERDGLSVSLRGTSGAGPTATGKRMANVLRAAGA